MSRRPNALDTLRAAALDGVVGVAPLPAPPTKDGARVVGGHVARGRGDAWERELDAYHVEAAAAGIAHLRRVGPPHVRTGPGGTEIKIIGRGPADYQGAIRGESGRPWRLCAVEAKSREGRLQRHEIEPHQRDDLAWVESVGGVALVLIELHDDRGVSLGTWAVPWGVLETLWRRTSRKRAATDASVESASVGPEELAGWAVPPHRNYLLRFAGGSR